MQLHVKGKNLEVSDSIRRYAERKLAKLDRKVHALTRVEVELAVERNPSVAANQVAGATVWFVVLPDGTMLVEDGPDSSLEPLATAVESELRPPYRAHAVRQGETLWVVQARRIEVLELPEAPEAEALDLTHTAEGTE